MSFVGAATTDRWWYWSWPLARLTMTQYWATREPSWRILSWLFYPEPDLGRLYTKLCASSRDCLHLRPNR
jgi:hypothetical protein